MNNEFKNTSRRGVLRAGITLVGAAGFVHVADAQDQPEKLAQSAVQYQNKPKGEQRCNVCVNWVPPNSCKIVAGNINPIGWCVAFAPKST